MSRIGHVTARHPHCPECGYDLVATVADHGRRCPECGNVFELHELQRAPRPRDWTPIRGLVWGLQHLALRGLVATTLLVAALILAAGLMNWLSGSAAGMTAVLGYAAIMVGLLIVSFAIGSVLGLGLNQAVGCEGMFPLVLGLCGSAVVVAAGVGLSQLPNVPVGNVNPMIMMAFMWLGAAVNIIRATLFEDY